jgi:hypothetical protein
VQCECNRFLNGERQRRIEKQIMEELIDLYSDLRRLGFCELYPVD